MCKLFALSNCNRIKVDDVLLKKISAIMISGQSDGLGIALKTSSGIWQHRGHDSLSALSAIGKIDHVKMFGDITIENSGAIPEKVKAMIIHSRTSTNQICIDSCHPFKLSDDFTLAHNGIISVPKNSYDLITTNDSEYLAHDYFTRGAENSLEDIKGYAATLCFNKKTLEVFKDDRAELHVCYSARLDTYLISTKFSDCVKIGELLSNDFCIPRACCDMTLSRIKIGTSQLLPDTVLIKKYKPEISKDLYDKSIGKYGTMIDYDRYDDGTSSYLQRDDDDLKYMNNYDRKMNNKYRRY